MRRDAVGVYAFWFRPTGKCIYVGQAAEQPIKTRLHQHWRDKRNQKLRLWMDAYGEHLDVCYATVARCRIGNMERRLIRLLQPEANEQHKR